MADDSGECVQPRFRLYLDDERSPPEPVRWVVARSVAQAKKMIEARGCPDQISFDHDLGESSESGFDLAKWLVNRDMDDGGGFIPEHFYFDVHSANPVGAENIRGYLLRYLLFRKGT